MVAKSKADATAGISENDDFFQSLEQEFYPSFVAKEVGDYLIGVFTGEMNRATTEWGDVLVLAIEYVEGKGKLTNGETPTKGEIYSVWFMGNVLDQAVKKARPTAGETIGLYSKGKRENKAGTLTYNDYSFAVQGREDKKKVTWDDVAEPVVEKTVVTDDEWNTAAQ